MCIIDEYDPEMQKLFFRYIVIEFIDKDPVRLFQNKRKAFRWGISCIEVKNRDDLLIARTFLTQMLDTDKIEYKVHEKEELPTLTGIPLPTDLTHVPHANSF